MRWLTTARIASAVGLDAEAELLADGADRALRALDVEAGAGPAHAAVGIDAPEHDVGVGDGRLGAAAAVGDRAGHGAGAARPDLQHAAAVDAAMLPPPAPIVCTSIIGRRSGMRKSRLVSSATLGSPSMTTATSKLVPPMSAVMTLSKPAAAAMLRPRP